MKTSIEPETTTMELEAAAPDPQEEQQPNARPVATPNAATPMDGGSTVTDLQMRAVEERAKLVNLVDTVVTTPVSVVLANLKLALSYLIIRLADKNSSVDRILDKMLKQARKRHGVGATKISKVKSLCRYTAPLLEWLRRRHPKLRQTLKKLLLSHLYSEPGHHGGRPGKAG